MMMVASRSYRRRRRRRRTSRGQRRFGVWTCVDCRHCGHTPQNTNASFLAAGKNCMWDFSEIDPFTEVPTGSFKIAATGTVLLTNMKLSDLRG
ncbi:hypothetical protein Mapa_003604 [Marchantia paleacea]|nr:hypothetical protein Mapa_003604 [Marchantia paleacea]